jgi:hypothetical protein
MLTSMQTVNALFELDWRLGPVDMETVTEEERAKHVG